MPQDFRTLDHVPSGAVVLSEGMVVEFWNVILERWTDIPRERILGRPLSEFYPHFAQPKYAARIENVLHGGPPAIFSSQIHRALIPCTLPDGGARVQHGVATAIPGDEQDAPFRVLLAIQDVTDLARSIDTYRQTRKRLAREIEERVEREARLRERERLLQSVIESADVILWAANREGVFTYSRGRVLSIFGLQSDEAVGTSISEFYAKHPDQLELFEQALRGEHVSSVGDFGDRFLHTFFSPVHDEDGEIEGVAGVSLDITERKKTEDALARSERMAAVGTLTSGIAHNFNNLNAGILGHLELILTREGLSETAQNRLELVIKTVKRSVTLTDSLLAISGRRRSKKEMVELKIILQDTVSLIRNEYESEGIVFDLEFDPKAICYGSPGDISHIAFNFLVNARHAMIDAQEKRLQIHCGRKEGRAFFYVQDTGHGVAPENLSKLFLPFFSTKGEHATPGSTQAQVRGSGLGLSVSDTIVREHGGEIDVSLPSEGGTRFTVWLPANASGEDAPVLVSTLAPSETIPFRRAMVLDDEDAVRLLVQDHLEGYEMAVESFSNAESALACLRDRPVDICFIDLQMPYVSGDDFLRRVRELPAMIRPHTVIVTGKPLEDPEAFCRSIGADALLRKPFSAQDVAGALSSLVS